LRCHQIRSRKGTLKVNDTGLLFEVEDVVLARPVRSVPAPVVSASEDDLTPVAGVALWEPLLDRFNVVAEADRRGLREIGPTGYSGGECYRALTEILLAGGDFLSDRFLLADRATATLRGSNTLPSVPTLYRFLAGADLGRVAKAAAVNRVRLRRAWAAGAAPEGDRLTIDRRHPGRGVRAGQGRLGVLPDRADRLVPVGRSGRGDRSRAGPAGPPRVGQRRPGDGPVHRRVRHRHPHRVPEAVPVVDPGRLGRLPGGSDRRRRTS
jgi:hypothetical protein